MDKVAEEIEAMVGTQTAVAVEGVTLWQRLIAWVAAWWALRSLPKGQRYVRAGFKAVTQNQIRARFALDAQANAATVAAAWEQLASLGITKETHKMESLHHYASLGQTSAFLRTKEGDRFEHKDLQFCLMRGEVVMQKLSRYIGDEIPPRCLESIKRAKGLGLKNFYVAFPVIGKVIAKDPIIICPWDSKVGSDDAVYLEIDMWE